MDAQPVTGDRVNVIATLDAPHVVFSTHFDCVPPFFPEPRRGRRAVRARVVRREGHARRPGRSPRNGFAPPASGASAWCLSSARSGAATARRPPTRIRWPTGAASSSTASRPTAALASATRGILRVKLSATGRAAHSSRPDLGESAIDKLLDALVRLRAQALPEDRFLGRTHYTIGLISGGIAPNVVSPHAEAEVMFRTVGPLADLEPALDAIRDLVETSNILEVPAVRLKTLDGFEIASFPFTTDIPFLDRWGEPLLVGPGSVLMAHTADEHVGIASSSMPRTPTKRWPGGCWRADKWRRFRGPIRGRSARCERSLDGTDDYFRR